MGKVAGITGESLCPLWGGGACSGGQRGDTACCCSGRARAPALLLPGGLRSCGCAHPPQPYQSWDLCSIIHCMGAARAMAGPPASCNPTTPPYLSYITCTRIAGAACTAAGVPGPCNPTGSNYQQFYEVLEAGSWLEVVMHAGHMQFTNITNSLVRRGFDLLCHAGSDSHQVRAARLGVFVCGGGGEHGQGLMCCCACDEAAWAVAQLGEHVHCSFALTDCGVAFCACSWPPIWPWRRSWLGWMRRSGAMAASR